MSSSGNTSPNTGATRAGAQPTQTGGAVQPVPTGSADVAKAAAIGLWIVVGVGLLYGVSQAVITAGKLFG
jgi:hypothetical protein